MAIHASLASMLAESMPEYLHVAEYCVLFAKGDSWPDVEPGGCLGYPAGAMLFAIVDAIGSYHRQDRNLKVAVDGKPVEIRKDGFQHFYILNSDYYGQRLSGQSIKQLYAGFRNILLHNAALAPEKFLLKASGNEPFPVIDGCQCVNLSPFLDISRKAVGNSCRVFSRSCRTASRRETSHANAEARVA